MKKRLFSFLLALCMIVSVFPVMAFAAEIDTGTCGPDITWTLDKGTLTFSGTGTMDDDDWLDCDRPWEANAEYITDVVISEGITEIGQYACRSLIALESIEIPASVTKIGSRAFASCFSLTEINFVGDAPAIGYEAFSGVTATAYYPEGNATWTEDVLQDYGGSLTWTDGTTVTPPDSVPEVTEPEETEPEETEPEEEEIPRSGRCGNYTYWELDDQGKLTITGEGKINGDHFEGAAPWYELRKEITAVELSDAITEIGHNAFYGCVNLTEVDMPIQLERLGDVFIGCTGLKKITFYGDAPEFYPQIGDIRTFEDVTATVYYPAGNATWTSDVMLSYGGNITWKSYDKDSVVLISGSCGDNATYTLTGDGVFTVSGSGPMTDLGTWKNQPWGAYRETVKKVVIADGITTVGEACFNSFINMTEVVIPDSVVHIGNSSFTNCTSLTSVDIPDGVTVIGEFAFSSCSGLTKIDLPDVLEEVGDWAFSHTSITSLVIPASVEKIGECAFACESLKKITFQGDAPDMENDVFAGAYATAYYPAGNATWTEEVMSDEDNGYTGEITWEAYNPNGGMIPPTVKASNVASTGKIRLTWAKVDGAVKYEIYRSSSKDGPFSLKYTATGTGYTNTGAKAGETYWYYVVAIGENGETAKSVVVSRTCTLARPNMKIGNVASTGKIRLTWEAVPGAVKYEVYRATEKDGEYTLKYTATGNGYTNTGAVVGGSYYYKVKAIAEDPAANSAFSVIKGRVCDYPRPTVTIGNDAETGKIVLAWKETSGTFCQYEISRATSQNGPYTVLGTVRFDRYTDTTAEAGVKYYYRVREVDHPIAGSAANSAYSAVKARVCDLPQPEITVTRNAKGKPTVRWEKIDGAVKYQVYRSTSKDGTYSLKYTTTGTGYTNTGAADGVTYYYKVRAVCSNTSGNSAFSAAKCPAAPLEAPEVSITLNAKGKPRLTWNKVDGAVKYQVYRATSPNGTYSLKYTTTGTGYANTGAAAGTTYYYKVRAVSDGTYSDSAYSEMVFINCSTVGISDCVAANEVIDRINEWREYAELPALEWYDEGLDAAKIRAAELEVLPSDTERPDGSSPEDLWEDYGVTIELCLVTQPGTSGEDLVDAMMLDEDLEDFGIVCLLDIWSGAVAARNGDYWIIMFVE